jgi:hypothetical protein
MGGQFAGGHYGLDSRLFAQELYSSERGLKCRESARELGGILKRGDLFPSHLRVAK